jgi:tRNA pseudouridine55 synthase
VVQLENLESTVHEFLGTYEQIPPMYSALKVNGRKLYELAREGKEVERTARQVTIQSIRLIYKDKNRAVIHAACSKGTYIRTLCEDIGQRLGLPATMVFLLRTRVGPFDVSQAVTLEEIAENPQNALLPAATAVSHLPASHFNELESLLLCQGRSIAMRSGDSQSSEPILTRLYKETGIFFGIGEFMIDSGMVKPIKIFADGNEEYVIV